MTETWQQTTERIAAYYDRLVETHGHDPRACDYGRSSSQARKFAVLADVGDLTAKSVLDVGCGFADFAEYLAARHRDIRYTGVDIAPPMIRQASQLRPALDLRQVDILQAELTERWDLVTANGIFYLLGEDARGLMGRLVTRMFDLATWALSFNSLSSWAPHKEPHEFYADPLVTLELCRALTPHVVLRHDYMAHDFTVYMYREATPG
ncbi:MAG TPA: class I SAM-dependent methyltransferase [Burkholderiaceae bacterium]|nr:class I SAM-dependent methyltransferase [Burkholderiaceae bacterium]